MFLSVYLATISHANSADYDASPIIESVIKEAIRPGFAAFKQTAKAMHESAEDLCTAPSEEALATAQSNFGDLVEKWARVEMIRLGPLASENRLERILFWPDRRGRGLKQVQDVIRTNDETALTTGSLAKKSVAVQGMLALEFTLFGSGFEVLNSQEGASRCGYAKAITGNLDNLAGEAFEAWSAAESSSISSLWLNPSETNPLFRDPREQMSALFKIVGEGLEITRVQRLNPFLQDGIETSRPKSAIFWRSNNSIASMRSNIGGLEAIMRAARLDRLTSGDDSRVVGSLYFEFGNASNALGGLDMSPAQIAQSQESYSLLNYAGIVIDSLIFILSQQLAAIFNLSAGFSSLDGD